MQIVAIGDNMHEMPQPNGDNMFENVKAFFLEKKKKKKKKKKKYEKYFSMSSAGNFTQQTKGWRQVLLWTSIIFFNQFIVIIQLWTRWGNTL